MATKYGYIGSCVSLSAEVVDWIRGRYTDVGGPKPQDISYSTFARHVPAGERQHTGLSTDWAVRFYRSTLPSGIPVIYYVHSGIEWVFVPYDKAYIYDEERALVEAAEATY